MTRTEAFRHCREIARREAKNFFWAFRVLPRHKSDAMCAVYAFMRKADDLSDDESLSIAERRRALAQWVEQWHSVRNGKLTDDPVFLAMHDVQQTFAIPYTLLDELISGVALDLERSPGQSPVTLQTYATFDELYRYCYLVASVVGLVSIRIFGYKDTKAEALAEETGIAFQLTNILRDVKEDFERGRLYLPLELLTEDGVPLERIAALCSGNNLRDNERAMLATIAIRAERLYVSGRQLMPLVDRDSRAALWVLLHIYHGLLNRMGSRRMEVFRERISMPGYAKLAILLRGAVMAIQSRVVA